MKTNQNLLDAIYIQASAARDVQRRIATGKLYVEAFGCALRIAGPGVDLIVARRTTITVDDLEPVMCRRSR